MPGGPVATVAATTESHPLPNYFSGVSLLKAFGRRERRLGALWLNAQREARRSHNVLIESMLRDVEGKLDPQIDEAKLRRDQTLMYTIFGDPATRLRLPERLDASIERTAAGWRWKAKKPTGVVRIEVGFRPLRPPLASGKGPRAGSGKRPGVPRRQMPASPSCRSVRRPTTAYGRARSSVAGGFAWWRVIRFICTSRF